MARNDAGQNYRDKIEWFPTINYAKCIGCLACFKKCKRGVYSVKEGKPYVTNPYGCVVGCTGCQAVCPAKAISHPPKSYLKKMFKGKEPGLKCRSCKDG